MTKPKELLNELGIFGFNHLEPVILASLITEDPLLLIGRSGTGKTLLLNKLAEILDLNHKHYNASYVSFDDLIGYPVPDEKKEGIHFLHTPVTIWGAQSVLIDEISRCKPEVQNKFFSIIQEKRIQGIALKDLCYRWAAMNPVGSLHVSDEDNYEGSMALDAALADRFAFIVEVPDWGHLTQENQEAILISGGKTILDPERKMGFQENLLKMKKLFNEKMVEAPREILQYCRIVTTLLNQEHIRISPRRAAMMVRNLVALSVVAWDGKLTYDSEERSELYKTGLRWSLPQRALKSRLNEPLLLSVHTEAMKAVLDTDPSQIWLTEFHLCKSASGKIGMILNGQANREVKSIAAIQLLGSENESMKAIFSFAFHPYVFENDLLTGEASAAIGKEAKKVFDINGELKWRENPVQRDSKHPLWSECVKYLNLIAKDNPSRKQKAEQVFLYLLCNDIPFEGPALIEEELNQCFSIIKNHIIDDNRRKEAFAGQRA